MNQAKLYLHCGTDLVPREQLARVVTPDKTATWQPIPHNLLLDRVTDTIQHTGLKIVTEAHGLTHDGNRYFGLLQVTNGQTSTDFGVVIGLRNSHDKRFPAGLVVGASVFVCDNLSFSGEIKLARKHTVNIVRDLPELVSRALGKLTDLREKQEHRFLTYKSHELTDAQAHDLVIQALDARVLPVTKIPDMIEEWRHPRHPEFVEAGKTAWRFFNGATQVLKSGNLDFLPRRTQSLHSLLDVACNLQTGTSTAAEPMMVQAV